MGEWGRKIVGGPAPALVKHLQRAYADEWFAHYNYQFVAHGLRGHRSPGVAALLLRKSGQAFERANRLALRILEMGGRPMEKLGDLEKHATDKPFKAPRDLSDVDGLLKAVLDAERTSIRTYHELRERVAIKDPLTEALAREFLGVAVAGEEELEKLIGDSAPEMTGR